MKRIIVFLLVICCLFSLSACMSDEDKERKVQNEVQAKQEMTQFLKEEFKNTKVLKVESIFSHSYSLFPSTVLTDFVKVQANIQNKAEVFIYDISTKTVFWQGNYENVCKELSDYVYDTVEVNRGSQERFDIYYSDLYACEEMGFLPYSVKSLQDVFEESNNYYFNAVIVYGNENDFKEYADIKYENLFKDGYVKTLKVFNVTDKIDLDNLANLDDYSQNTNPNFMSIQDYFYYGLNIANDIIVKVNHKVKKMENGFIIMYDNQYVDLSLEKCSSFGEPKSTQSQSYSFKSVDKAFTLKTELKRDMLHEIGSHISYFSDWLMHSNSLGTKTYIEFENALKVYVYIPAKEYKELFFNDRYNEEISNVSDEVYFKETNGYISLDFYLEGFKNGEYSKAGYFEMPFEFYKGEKIEKAK